MARRYSPDELDALLHESQRDATRPTPVTLGSIGAQMAQAGIAALGAAALVGGGLWLLGAPDAVLVQGPLLAGLLTLGGGLVIRVVPADKAAQFRRIQAVQRMVIEAEFRKRQAYAVIERLEAEHDQRVRELEKTIAALRGQNNTLRAENDGFRERLNPRSPTHVTAEPIDTKARELAVNILQRWFATLRPNERGEMVGDWLSRRAAERANWTQDQHAAAVGLLSRAGIVVQRGNFYRVVDAYRDLPSALHQLDAYYAPRVREAPLPQRASYVESDDD